MQRLDEAAGLTVASLGPLDPLDELVALDLLTLAEHTAASGDVLDADSQRQLLERTLPTAELLAVRRDGALVAYALLRPLEAGR